MTNQRNDTLIAYFSVHDTSDGEGYIGAMIVIDEKGVPQEFRCTVPVRPTDPHKALYGSTLQPHIFNELIGSPLMAALSTRPKCYIVDDKMLLELREYTDTPVVHFEDYGESLSPDSESTNQHRLDSSIGGFQPITAITHRDYATDYEAVREQLEDLFNRIDLSEPFERIKTAIKVLSGRDERFR